MIPYIDCRGSKPTDCYRLGLLVLKNRKKSDRVISSYLDYTENDGHDAELK